MSATELMLVAFLLAVVGKWAHKQKAIPSGAGLVEIIFSLLVVSLLDQGRTQGIARGFAWLFLAAVVLSDNSPLTGLAKLAAKNNPAQSVTAGAAAGAAGGGGALAGGAAGTAGAARAGGSSLVSGLTR